MHAFRTTASGRFVAFSTMQLMRGCFAHSQVADIITPLIAAIFGGSNFGDLYFTVNYSKFMYGDLINNASSPNTFCSSSAYIPNNQRRSIIVPLIW